MSLVGQVKDWVDGALEDVRGAIAKAVADLGELDQRVQALETYVGKIEQSDGIPDDPKPRAVSAPATRGTGARKTAAKAGTAEARGTASP